MKRNFVLLLAVLVVAVFAVQTTNASVPMLISHQGRLLDASNQPVTGTRNLTFKIFETPTGGNPLWTETHLAVPVSNGLFSVILGSTITISGDLIVTGGTLETERYLAIQVGGDVSELSPRRRLTSSAYAVASSRVSGDIETLPGALAIKSMGGSTTGTIRMVATADSVGNYLDVDDDGDGIAQAKGIITVKAGSGSTGKASSVFSYDTDDDGVVDNTVEQVSNSSKAYLAIKTKGTGAQRTTILSEASDSGFIDISVDDDGDGTARAKGIIVVKGGSGTGSASGKLSFDTDDNGVADMSSETVVDSGGARTSWTGVRGGSTTGTIRIAATPDSADHEVSVDDTPTGVSSKVKEKAKMTKCSVNLAYLRTSAPASSTELDESCDAASASSKWKGGMSGSTTGTIRMAAAPESSLTVIEHDDDGDGIAQARGIIVTKGSGGGSTGSVSQKFTFDTDDNGVSDNDVDLISNGAGAGARLIGRGGSTTGTIRMTATPDSSVFDLGISGSTTGTIRIQTGSAGTANPIEHSSGAHLTVGGTWTNASDKNAKENFSDVNGADLLEKIEDLAITQWNYKSEDESVTHIGPTAQDFKDLFGVGGDDKSISTVDPSGIALAAIKELNKQNQELANRNKELKKELDNLKKKVDELISRR